MLPDRLPAPPPFTVASRRDVIRQMEPFVAEQLSWLQPVDSCWQPSDVLPDLVHDGWRERLDDLRETARALPDAVLVVLVGNTVTEEALPSYQTMANRHTGILDETGASDTPWARWTRGWTAEENRHGQLLSSYLTLSGRVNMRAVEVTTQYLLRNGFDPQTGNDPYKGLIYTAFQERATRVSHANVAQLAQKSGAPLLGRICTVVAGDEARHEEAYKHFVARLFELDPAGTMIAFADMMRAKITMPARLMTDGAAQNLFGAFSIVAQSLGVYTAQDYAAILQHLLEYWRIAQFQLAGAAAQAQTFLCALPDQYLQLAERLSQRTPRQAAVPFTWIFGRTA